MSGSFFLDAPSAMRRAVINRALVDRVVSRTAAAVGIVYAAQSAPATIDQINGTHNYWLYITYAFVVGSLLVALVNSIIGRGVRIAFAIVAWTILAALVLWPIEASNPGIPEGSDPWIYYLCSVGTGSAALAFRPKLAFAFTLAVPIAFAVLRVTPAGASAPIEIAVLEGTYVTLLGVIVLAMILLLRGAADGVDAAQAQALERYTDAARAHATEHERIRVDALVHDDVLGTLLSAARARDSKSQALARISAERAIRHLQDAQEGFGTATTVIPPREFVDRLSEISRLLPVPFAMDAVVAPDAVPLPINVVESVLAAAQQAMTNSANHAGADATRSVFAEVGAEGLTVRITDDGRGFSLEAVSAERLGVRVSVIGRVESVGGAAVVRSAPGEGTVVELTWLTGATSGVRLEPEVEALR
ncbi:MAG TPA: histidine kinase [Naasia sp.]|jgi:signal transduction histidine kinase